MSPTADPPPSETGLAPNGLSQVRQRLRAIRIRRLAARLLAATTGFFNTTLWILFALFCGDLLFDMDALQRLVAIGLAIAAAFWLFKKMCWPWLRVHEDPIQIALQVERNHGIDSDLVAALQFTAASSLTEGSTRLQEQVIEGVASEHDLVTVGEAPWDRLLWRRSGWLFFTGTVLLVLGIIYSEHAEAFAARLAFRPVGYPTATRIEQLVVSTNRLNSRSDNPQEPFEASVIEHAPVDFWVRVAGSQPATGQIDLQSIVTQQRKSVSLSLLTVAHRVERLQRALRHFERLESSGGSSTDWLDLRRLLVPDAIRLADSVDITKVDARQRFDFAAKFKAEVRAAIDTVEHENEASGLYQGRLERLSESATMRLRLGDSRIPPGTLRMLSLPVVQLTGQIEPPAYTERGQEPLAGGITQLTVLEGSTIELGAVSLTKQLDAAWLTIEKDGQAIGEFKLRASDTSHRVWEFTEVPSPFRQIREEVRFALQVTDSDGLHLAEPLRGGIQLQADQPPAGTLSSLHATVLATAKPVVSYTLRDDFAISQARLRIGLAEKEDGSVSRELDSQTVEIQLPRQPLTSLPFEGRIPVDISTLGVAIGEQVQLHLEVVDDRGGQSGESFQSPPLFWNIGDEAAVLDSIAELDKETEERLTEIIQQQLEVRNSYER